jgi:hypothetical protein
MDMARSVFPILDNVVWAFHDHGIEVGCAATRVRRREVDAAFGQSGRCKGLMGCAAKHKLHTESQH